LHKEQNVQVSDTTKGAIHAVAGHIKNKTAYENEREKSLQQLAKRFCR